MMVKNFCLDLEQSRIKGNVYLPPEGPQEVSGLVILCHGIPGGGTKDPKDLGYAHLATSLTRKGYAAVVFNFRGAGESSGDFDMMGWIEDLEGVVDYARNLTSGLLETVLFGFSAGAAVAVYAAAHTERIGALVLCGCPADFITIQTERGIEQFLEHTRQLGIISTPGFPSDRAKWVKGFETVRPERWIGEVGATRKLILHGDADDVVPVEHAYRLYNKAQEPKELIIMANGGHRLRLDDAAMRRAMDWLTKQSG